MQSYKYTVNSYDWDGEVSCKKYKEGELPALLSFCRDEFEYYDAKEININGTVYETFDEVLDTFNELM